MQNQKLINPNWVIAWGPAARSRPATWATSGFAVIGAEPTFSPDRRFVLVGDCCFDRTPMLKQQIDTDGLTDLAIVARLWEQYGTKTLSLLSGQFALAVWDRDEQTLCLGRDRVGAKTLYYTRTGTTRWISPRLRSLNPYHDRELDLVALRDYLCCAFVPGAQTLWEAVRELRPGSYLYLPDLEVQRYWQPQEQITNADRPLEWHSQQVRSLLEQLVQEALPAGEPVAAYLSGGIDSSCVAAIATRLHDRPVHTFSMHFGAQYPSEIEFANIVAPHCGTEHHVLEVSPQQIWELLPETLVAMDDPVGEGLTVPNLLLGRSAKQFADAVLNGEGGDPCFGGPKNKPMLLNRHAAIAPYLDRSLIREWLNYRGEVFPGYGLKLWLLVTLEIWLQVNRR